MEDDLIYCLKIALKHNVTDIHFNIRNDTEVKVEMRVHGRIKELRKQFDISFFRYLQYRANLDVTNVTEPQTGQFEVIIDNNVYSLRFAIVSSYHVKSGVLRILNNHEEIELNSLSSNESQIEYFKSIQDTRNGLFIFSGPTGSGKTTTLYTILDSIQGRKIFTLEDPIELFSDKYVQIQINERQNMSYAEGIKQLMRHDPDIIMIGEIRDSEAANMAVRSALTGHVVITSIHSSSCVNAINRMIELGVNEYQLRDVLTGVSNQRLYDTTDNKKIGVYEIMDRKEIIYYFKNKTNSDRFIPLHNEVEKAVENGIIFLDQAKQDLY